MTYIAAADTLTVIRPRHGWVGLNLADLWAYRELVYFLAWRDVKVRYKQTVIGVAWVIIQPLFTMAVFSIFFGRLAKMPSDGLPYPLFALAGLVPWIFFANALTTSSVGLVENANLVKKVYFPRMALPLSSVLAGLIDLAIATLLLCAAVVWYGFLPGPKALFLPLFVVIAAATALGVGLWLSALNVRYRDVRYALPFVSQLWLVATPIAYPSSLLTEPYRSFYALNPMVGVVEGFRWALLGTIASPWPLAVISTSVSVLLLVSGAVYFRRMEKSFADVV